MSNRKRHDPYIIASLVRIGILIWSAGLLTASYMNIVKNPDEAFIASIFTAALSTFGIEKISEKSSTQTPKPPSQPRPVARKKPPGTP